MVGDLSEDPNQPASRIDLVQLGCLDEVEGDCHGFAARFGPA